MSGQLRLAVLGRPELALDTTLLPASKIALKGQALLIYLAVNGQPASRSTLAGLFWGDMAEESARANLRLTLAKLRQVIPESHLWITRQEIGLTPGYWLDVTEFETLLGAGKRLRPLTPSSVPQAQKAAALYRGRFLEQFYIPGLIEFEEWAMPYRERLHQTALATLLDLAQVLGQQGEREAAMAAAHRLLALEPWHEEGHRQLIWLLAAAGQRSAALAQYETCRRLLTQELGVEPAAETIALVEKIKRDELPRSKVDRITPYALPSYPVSLPAAPIEPESLLRYHPEPAVPQHNLPSLLTPFIGREEELDHLYQKLGHPDYRLITLTGQGGMGKTRLALALAGQCHNQFTHGVWFIALAELTEAGGTAETNPINQVATAISAALGLSFATAQEPLVQMLNLLRSRHCLLILDNFEIVLAAAPLVADILRQAPQVKLIVTSREPLNFQAEWVYRLEGLPVPEQPSLENAGQFASLRLFRERAERTSGRNPLTAETVSAISQICRFVGGSPLGIELAASWTRWAAPAQIWQQLQENYEQLTSMMRDIPDRHRSLRAVFDYSWALLSPDEQQTLAQLSLFRGHFSVKAATTITAAPLPTLFALADKSLLQHADDGRFYLHELLQQYAAGKLASLALDVTELQRRFVNYYLGVVSRHQAALNGPQPQIATRRLQGVLDNLHQAWRWGIEHACWSEIAAAVTGLGLFWKIVGPFDQAAALLQQAITPLPPADEAAPEQLIRLRGQLLSEQAVFFYELSRLDDGVAAAQEAIDIGERLGDQELMGWGYLRLGNLTWAKTQYDISYHAYQQAITLGRASHSPHLEAIALHGLGVHFWRQADQEQATRYAQESLRISRRIGDVRNEARSQFLLSLLAVREENYELAQQLAAPAMQLAQEMDDRRSQLSIATNLGLIAGYVGEIDAALRYSQENLRLARELGSVWSEGVALSNLGDLYLRLGDYASARQCYDRSVAILQELNARDAASNVLAYRGLLAFHQADYVVGEQDSRQALVLAMAAGVKKEQALAQVVLAHNRAALGGLAEAEQLYRSAAAIWQTVGKPSRYLEAVAGIARMAYTQGHLQEALEQTEIIISHLEQGVLPGIDDPVWVYLTIYQVLQAVGDGRSNTVLMQAAHFLEERAAKIGDEAIRQSWLENVSFHRELCRLLEEKFQVGE